MAVDEIRFYNRNTHESYGIEYRIQLVVEGEVVAVLYKYEKYHSELFWCRPYDDITGQELMLRLGEQQYLRRF